jgi:hypothetical protein
LNKILYLVESFMCKNNLDKINLNQKAKKEDKEKPP